MNRPGKLCMCCMNAVPQDSKECPSCGFNGMQKNPGVYLQIGHRIAGRYVVGGVFSSDSESVTYNGFDISSSKKVLICEYLPAHGCYRAEDGCSLLPKSGAEQHYKSALADFKNLYFALSLIDGEPSLIDVLDYFEANNTAYAVQEYFHGVALKDFLRMGGGAIRYDQCESIMAPVFSAVEALHSKGIIHGGISPSTVFINRNGDVKLAGYATPSVRTKGTEVASKLFVGYAAPEQYGASSPKTTATDVYALAAVVYRCLTGITPQESEHRRSYDTLQPAVEYDPTVPAHVSRALELAMLLNEAERVQTVSDLRDLLNNAEAERRLEIEEANAVVEDEYDEEEEEYEEVEIDREERSENMVRVVMFVAIAFFCISLVAFAINALLPSPDKSPVKPGNAETQMFVPDYVGKVFSQALIVDSDYVYEIVYEASDTAQPNEVVRQYPLKGANYEKGDVITLYVNRYQEVGMVKLIGLSMDEALDALEKAGIKNFRLEQKQSTDAQTDEVIAQSVKAGERYNIYSDELVITVAIKIEEAE